MICLGTSVRVLKVRSTPWSHRGGGANENHLVFDSGGAEYEP